MIAYSGKPRKMHLILQIEGHRLLKIDQKVISDIYYLLFLQTSNVQNFLTIGAYFHKLRR